MKNIVLREAPWVGQVSAYTIDALLAFAAVLGLFHLGFHRTPNILTSFDFTIIIALNSVVFALPALMFDGNTIGMKLLGYQITKAGRPPVGWVSLVRGLYFFPFGMVITGFHLPLKLLMSDHAPFDPMFGLRLKSKKPMVDKALVTDMPPAEAVSGKGSMIFGTNVGCIDDARQELERALGIKFEERESAFWGPYFACKAYGNSDLMLLPSGAELGPDSDKGKTTDFSQLFYANAGGAKANLICDLLATSSYSRLD